VKRSVALEEILPSIETVYETSPKRPKIEITVDDDDDGDIARTI